jgi:hypothetical protein
VKAYDSKFVLSSIAATTGQVSKVRIPKLRRTGAWFIKDTFSPKQPHDSPFEISSRIIPKTRKKIEPKTGKSERREIRIQSPRTPAEMVPIYEIKALSAEAKNPIKLDDSTILEMGAKRKAAAASPRGIAFKWMAILFIHFGLCSNQNFENK